MYMESGRPQSGGKRSPRKNSMTNSKTKLYRKTLRMIKKSRKNNARNSRRSRRNNNDGNVGVGI